MSRAAALAGLLTATVTAGSAVATEPTMPLSDVRAGMTGTAYTVVRGTDITSFPVTITDVQSGPDGPGGPLILIRAEGSLMQQTGGIAEGMSGSPVYVTGTDGVRRLIGAISYGFGDEANVVGGITPIERMLAVSSGARALQRTPAARATRPIRMVRDRAAAVRMQRAHPGLRAAYPLQRWTVAGVDPRLGASVRTALGARAEIVRMMPRAYHPAVKLEPGASMTVLAAGGDLVVGAIGTVTWVDGDTVIGFGHPFTGAGPSRLLLGDGYVYSVVSAPIRGGSFKDGEPGTVQGMITGDRRDAVVGRVGPVEAIRVHTVARDTRRQTVSDLDVVLAPQPEMAAFLGDVLQIEPLLRARDGLLDGTLRLRVTLRGGDLPRPVVYENTYASAGDVTGVSAGAVVRPLVVLMHNGVKRMEPGSVEISQTIDPDIEAGRLLSAVSVPARVRPGQRVRVRLRLQMFRGAVRTVTIPFRVPADVDSGAVSLRIVPNDPTGFDANPADLTLTLGGQAAQLRARAAVRIAQSVIRAAPTGKPSARVMRAVRRLSSDRHDAVRVLGAGDLVEDTEAGVRVRVPGVVIAGGRALLRLNVR